MIRISKQSASPYWQCNTSGNHHQLATYGERSLKRMADLYLGLRILIIDDPKTHLIHDFKRKKCEGVGSRGTCPYNGVERRGTGSMKFWCLCSRCPYKSLIGHHYGGTMSNTRGAPPISSIIGARSPGAKEWWKKLPIPIALPGAWVMTTIKLFWRQRFWHWLVDNLALCV